MDVTKHIHIILNTQTFNFESMGPESSLALFLVCPTLHVTAHALQICWKNIFQQNRQEYLL